MGFVPGGGFVVTTKKDSWVYRATVTEETLRAIADLLKMKDYVKDQLPIARAIHVYRGRFVTGAKGKGAKGKGGNGRRKSTRKR